MAPKPTSDELYGHHTMPSPCEFVILMPNGLGLSMNCTRDARLEKIKSEVWSRAKNEIMFRLLKGTPASYVFVGITSEGKKEEFYDENRRLCELKLFQPILRLVVPEGEPEEMKTESSISQAVGRPVCDFDSIKDQEFIDCRRAFMRIAFSSVRERMDMDTQQKLLYFFPIELDTYRGRTQIEECNSKEELPASIYSPKESGSEVDCFEVRLKMNETPEEVLKELRTQHSLPNERLVLKVVAFEVYFLGNHKLCNYKYISRLMSQNKKAELVICKESDLLKHLPRDEFLSNNFFRRSRDHFTDEQRNRSKLLEDIENKKVTHLWQTSHQFEVQVNVATYCNVKDLNQVFVKVGIFHGTESLCEPKETDLRTPQSPKWQEKLFFDLHCEDIPRGAKLCLCLCSSLAAKKNAVPIAYGNIPLFDHKDRLRSGKANLSLWRVPKEHTGLLYPLGVTGLNPEKDALSLEIEFENLSIVFPPDDFIEMYTRHLRELEAKNRDTGQSKCLESRRASEGSDEQKKRVEEIVRRDPLADLVEEEKQLLWKLRNHCSQYLPDSLPKVLEAVKWHDRQEVAELYNLLKLWKPIKTETALELLDCKFTDPKVRSFAVENLDRCLPDHLLKQYLLQLVEVVLHEPYLNNDVAQFLLRRALKNRQVGNFFFWLLRAEIHDPLKSRLCSLVLEAYCRGIGSTLLEKTKTQVDALDKLVHVTDLLKDRKDSAPDKRLSLLRDTLQQTDYTSCLHDLLNPLRPAASLGQLKIDDCRIMNSAKRPLWLVWENGDVTGKMSRYNKNDVHEIIFKNGDDLRQDMLTLQVITIMDSIWRSEDLDLKMLPYTCLATGKQVGLIEVVRNARTVMNLQRSQSMIAAYQLGPKELYKWFVNTKDDSGHRLDTFTRSCAGYCVATLVLGIGDRNPDNIMINDDGQIFHIDFGHFLGHFKKKFGISRERVPFVLTADFLYVISRGKEISDSNSFVRNFFKLCEDAYLILRKHANLLITLFTLMLSTGIPELQTPDDIEYLRTTLQVDKSDQEALEYLRTQLREAKTGSMYTRIDWFFHNVRR